MSEQARTAVLLLAHGTPDEISEIPEYLKNVTGGRGLPDAVVQEISHRYALIGHSPLTDLTLEQGRLLAEALGAPVYVGMRNWKPYIADTVAQMRADGITSAVVICLAPQNSRTSVGLYKRAVTTATEGSIAIDFIEGWADHPKLADAFAERLLPLWEQMSAEHAGLPVLFTAHSVPCRTIQAVAEANADPERLQRPAPSQPDPYPNEAKTTAAMVAARTPGLDFDRCFFAFQSQGASGGPWLGPTVEDTLTALRQAGHSAVLLQPIGFLCDHVEILYDIDIAFRDFAAKLGMRLERPRSLNDSPLLIEALTDLARRGFERLDGRP